MTILKRKNNKRQQLKDLVVHNIQNGELSPGSRLLPVNGLAKALNASVSVTYQALCELVDEEYIESRGSMGFYVRNNALAPEIPEMAKETARVDSGNRKVFFCCCHHSDLIWKRGYQFYEGIRSKQFAFFEHMLKTYPEFHCMVEQAEVLDIYLKEHPEKVGFYQQAHQEGRFGLTGGGSIPDVNLVSGETIVRVAQAGKRFFRRVFGEEVTIDNRNDSFGLCAQLPQIIAKSGYQFMLGGRLVNCPPELASSPFNWQGLDGSSITVFHQMHPVDHLAATCNAPYIRTEEERLYETILKIRKSNRSRDIYTTYGGEVNIPKEEMIPMIQRANSEPGNAIVEFGSTKDFCARLDIANLPRVTGEFNPIFTGCYTTRITVKQNFRAAENALFAAEMFAAYCHVECDFANAWHNMLQTSFHDGICGCHHDSANREVMEKIDAVVNDAATVLTTCSRSFDGFTVFHPGSSDGRHVLEWDVKSSLAPAGLPLQIDGEKICCIAELPSAGVKCFPAQKASPRRSVDVPLKFKTKFFEVDFTGVYPEIKDQQGVLSRDGFGEILFRHEVGSMWSERVGSPVFGRDFLKEQVVSCEKGDLFYRVEVQGEAVRTPQEHISSFNDGSDMVFWSGFSALKYRKIYRFYHEFDYFTVKIILNWQGKNTKIQVRFPLNLEVIDAAGLFSIPFGSVVRAPYYEVTAPYKTTLRELRPECYQDAAGDWPALHWVDYSDLKHGCAIANNGTPGHQCVNGNIIVSLLRSGTDIRDGFMDPEPGSLDNGTHEYDFAIRPHSAADRAGALRLGEVLNRKPIVFANNGTGKTPVVKSYLKLSPDNLVISSLRQTDLGLIIRVYESLGRTSRAEFELPWERFATEESDLQELSWKPVNSKLDFSPFEIKTLRLKEIKK